MFGRGKDGQGWTGPHAAKGPEQVNKGKVGPRVMWARVFSPQEDAGHVELDHRSDRAAGGSN